MDDAVSIARDKVLPLMKDERGFKSLALLTDPSTNNIISVSFWETEADAKASETAHTQQRLPLVAHVFTEAPVTKTYQVSVQS
jgi:heme-degrading monooxygenase HmoA